MTFGIIKNLLHVLSFSILNIIKTIGSCLELKYISSKDVRMTLKYKTCRVNHSIPMSFLMILVH